MPTNSRFFRFVLESPLFLIVFALIPGALITSRLFHGVLPFRVSTRMLMVNAIGLLICLVIRFIHCLIRVPRPIRYGAERRKASAGTLVNCPVAVLRANLETAGYRITDDGNYAEKRDIGYLGTLLMYGFLLLLVATGVRDNLYQFSGTFIHGLGVAASLDKTAIYFPVIKGPLASVAVLPLLDISKQIFPDKDYPKGATEIVLLSKDGMLLLRKNLIAGGDPAVYQGFDIYLAKMLVDASLKIKVKDGRGKAVFEDAVKLSPLLDKQGDYNYYGAFGTPEAGDGDLYYDSSHNNFRIVLTKGGKKLIDTVYEFQRYRDKTEGDFTLEIAGIGRWSELHVVHKRHIPLIVGCGIMAVLGLMARIFFRPQRVWLEETAEGCRVWGAYKQ